MSIDNVRRALRKVIDEQPVVTEDGALWVDHNGIPMICYVAVSVLALRALEDAAFFAKMGKW